MRKAFIAFGILAFLAYCWASVAYQNQVDVPGYREVDVDVLGGMTRAAWDADPRARFQRLMDLENGKFLIPAGAAEREAGSGGRWATAADFAARADAGGDAPVVMRLLDTSEERALLALGYQLRDSIYNPDAPAGAPLHFGGSPLDKPMLDDLRARGIAVITVSGHAAPVNFQLGTAVMIALIFFTLTAALKPVIWDPFLVMLEKRRSELEAGAEAERQNRQEAVLFEQERARRHAELGREIQLLAMEGQRAAAGAAAEIVQAAREREKAARMAGLAELSLAAERARGDLEERVPELARAIADAVVPGGDAGRDRMES